jgi:hypothetical protein
MDGMIKSQGRRGVAVWLAGIGALTLVALLIGGVVAREHAPTGASVMAQRAVPSNGVAVSPRHASDHARGTPSAALPTARTSDGTREDAGTTLPAGVGQDWWSAVQKDIAASEYRVTRQKESGATSTAGTYQAPNRAQNLRTFFAPEGITITPRSGDGPSWQWGLSLRSYGLGDASREVQPATQVANGNRIEYRRGALTEWYVNDQRGVEQGFTVQSPPDSGQSSARLHLDLAVTGGVKPVLTDGGQAVDLIAEGGARVLRYAELKVSDATGQDLAASMVLSGCDGASDSGDSCTLRLLADTAGATWPITIDPLATSPSWSAESNQASAMFGWCVASAGDINGDGYADVVVSAAYYDTALADAGRVYVYHGSALGLAANPSWTADGTHANESFGMVVAGAGDVNGDGYSDVAVSTEIHSNGTAVVGGAFVYHGSASGLPSTPSWTAEGEQTLGMFGYCVAGAGDVNGDGYGDLIVGAIWYGNGESKEGQALVYHGSATGLSSSANWTTESNQAEAWLGFLVDSAGDVNGDGYSDVIVSAPRFANGESNEGAAFVYLGSATGLPVPPNASWMTESDQADAQLGIAVAGAGDVNGDGYGDVVVGAMYFDNVETAEGKVWVYHGSATGLPAAASPSWTAEGNQASANFGVSVASAGDVNGDGYADLVVGARGYDDPESNEGAAFVYFGSSAGLPAAPSWTGEINQASASFGTSVGGAGDVNGDGYSDVIVGAHTYQNGQSIEGAAFVFHGAASGLPTSASWTGDSDQADAWFGWSVASAGDVDGDGYADVIVGAVYYDNGQANEGRAFVYQGSAAGLSTSASWTAESDQANARFGNSVASAGDVNGDGYADVIVGSWVYDNGELDEGRAFVYHGSSKGLSSNASWTAEGDQASAIFGVSVASAGDVNGDGYADVIVGADAYDNGQNNEGRVFVYHGSPSGLAVGASWSTESNQVDALLGWSAASAGDVNGDGYGDVIVGAYGYDNGETGEGRAFVYHGSATGLLGSASWTAEGDQADAWFGYSVASAGDVDGDGYADVIIGAHKYDNGETDEGRAFVYLGSASGIAAKEIWTAESDQADANFGWSVASTGDVNGDGYADVIVGAYWYDNGETDEGRAFVYHGSVSGLATSASWTAESDQALCEFGWSVASAGDVNGDGFADVIVGGYGYDNGENDEGQAFLYYGNGGTGRLVAPQQLHGNGSLALAQPWGAADDPDDFQVRAWHSSPFGRDRVKTEIEACPSGVPFGDASCRIATSSVWTDSTASANGAVLTQTMSSLTPGTLYRWRERTLRAPYTVTQTGITPPPNPAHGPWRRLQGQAFEADIRTRLVYPLTVSKVGAGTGTVTSAPAGIDCGATCSAYFEPDTSVSLSQVAAAGTCGHGDVPARVHAVGGKDRGG